MALQHEEEDDNNNNVREWHQRDLAAVGEKIECKYSHANLCVDGMNVSIPLLHFSFATPISTTKYKWHTFDIFPRHNGRLARAGANKPDDFPLAHTHTGILSPSTKMLCQCSVVK